MKKLRKISALVLSLAMIFALASCGPKESTGGDTSAPPADSAAPAPAPAAGDMKVAMITDYGDITDQSFNQTSYEACKAYCGDSIPFSYYKPAGDSTAERVAMVDKAISDGYNVIVMPGYAFAETIKETANSYPETTFIALDVGKGDLDPNDEGYALPSNVYCAVYQEELCGYMAGYAAVNLGYTHLGFLGGMAVPAVVRYGYGFVQGADAAAAELGVDVTVEYVYGNQFYGDADITSYMDTWYQNLGVQAVFACGGGIYASAAEAAAKVDGAKVIGVDVDQSGIIDGSYGAGLTVTSAMKGLAATVKTMLGEVQAGNFAAHGGKIETLGLVSGTDVESNYVQLPTATTQWSEGFAQEDYVALVGKLFDGTVTVSNDISIEPAANALTGTATVNSYSNIK